MRRSWTKKWRPALILFVVWGFVATAGAASVWADEATEQTEPQAQARQGTVEGEASDGEELAEGSEQSGQEQTKSTSQGTAAGEEREIAGGSLVIITYMILWLMVGAFLVVTLWRQAKLGDDIDGLERRIDELLDGS